MKRVIFLIFFIALIVNLPKTTECKTCPPNFKAIVDSCYYFSQVGGSWLEAGKYCQDMRSRLVSIETAEESLHLNFELLYRQRNDLYWTSGTDLGSEGHFRWSSSIKPFEYSLWCKGEPNNQSGNEHCLEVAHINHQTCWNDLTCDTKRLFICEI